MITKSPKIYAPDYYSTYNDDVSKWEHRKGDRLFYSTRDSIYLTLGSTIKFAGVSRLHYDTNVAFDIPTYEYMGRPYSNDDFYNAVWGLDSQNHRSHLPFSSIPDAWEYLGKPPVAFTQWYSQPENKKLVEDAYHKKYILPKEKYGKRLEIQRKRKEEKERERKRKAQEEERKRKAKEEAERKRKIEALQDEIKRLQNNNAETFEAEMDKVVDVDCVNIVSKKSAFTGKDRNFYRVSFRDAGQYDRFGIPAWAARAAETMGTKYYGVSGCKMVMGMLPSGKWQIQAILIPNTQKMNKQKALKIANHMQDRIEKEGKFARKKCLENEIIEIYQAEEYEAESYEAERIQYNYVVHRHPKGSSKGGWFKSKKAEEYGAESFRVGDEGMFEGGEVRITSIENNSEDGRQNVYFFTYLDEEGNSDGFTHTSGERRFLNQFSMFPRDWNAEDNTENPYIESPTWVLINGVLSQNGYDDLDELPEKLKVLLFNVFNTGAEFGLRYSFIKREMENKRYNAEEFGAEKGYDGWINESTSYRKGGGAGQYNIFENDKYKKSVGVDDFKKMVIAQSRFKKDWKDVVLDDVWSVWPQTYDKKHPEKFVKLPFSNYNWRHGDVAKKNAETFSTKPAYGLFGLSFITGLFVNFARKR